MTTYSIAKQLNSLDIPTRYAIDKRGVRGKATANQWRPSRVYNVLRNPMYMGTWSYGKRTKKAQPILTTVTLPNIVDEAVFNRAQNRLKENCLWADRNSKRIYLLHGLIHCDVCGHSYSGYCSRSTKHGELRYYRCNRNGQRGNLLGEGCDSPSVPADLIENLLWQKIIDFVKNPQTVKTLISNRLASNSGNMYEIQINDSEKRVEELLESEKRLLRLYAEPKTQFSREALDSQIEEITQAREILKKQINQLTQDRNNEDELKKRLESIDFILDKVSHSINDASLETKRQIIENLVLEIRVSKDPEGNPALKITFAFDDDNLLVKYQDSALNGVQNPQLHSACMSVQKLTAPINLYCISALQYRLPSSILV